MTTKRTQMGTQQKDTKVTTMGTTKMDNNGETSRGDGGAAYHNLVSHGRPWGYPGKTSPR